MGNLYELLSSSKEGPSPVSANNLNRDEAAERSRLLTIERTAVHLDLTTSESTFRSRAEITLTCAEPGSPSFLNLTAPSVQSVTVDGVALDVDEVFDGNRIALPALGARSTIVVDATCAFSRTGEGLHRFVDPVDGTVYLHSQFETFDAHRMYACFDQPDLKTVFALTVTAPADWSISPCRSRTMW
jgi:aminopeptidase N